MPATITRLLHDWSGGDAAALEKLIALVYDQLHQIAARQIRNEQQLTIQPTELIHEAFVRLTGSRQEFRDRLHFYGAAAGLMRRILIDLARKSGTVRRGAGTLHVELPQEVAAEASIDFLVLDRALEKLEAFDPRQAQVVMLRFFGGLSYAEVAQLLDVSEPTAKRDWVVARAWLRREIFGE
jgi:RNA polymerase sigma-70 factor, ECF subfamily